MHSRLSQPGSGPQTFGEVGARSVPPTPMSASRQGMEEAHRAASSPWSQEIIFGIPASSSTLTVAPPASATLAVPLREHRAASSVTPTVAPVHLTAASPETCATNTRAGATAARTSEPLRTKSSQATTKTRVWTQEMARQVEKFSKTMET